MQRIPTVNVDSAPAEAKPVLEQIKKQFGRVPNIFASVAHSPVALNTLMSMFAALEKGALAGKTHEAVALRIGEIHGCRYCVAAHSAKAKRAGATADEIISFRKGEADDPKLKALLSLTTAMVEKRGQITDNEIQIAKNEGLSDSDILEALAIVVLNTFTNYINALVKTDLDFPAAPPLE